MKPSPSTVQSSASTPVDNRGAAAFYTQLAAWWPLISPLEDYQQEAEYAARILRTGPREVRSVLELGSGGGHNAKFLSQHFAMTLVDLSGEMLEMSRHLNPGCRHEQGDMRTVRLNERFDALFVHDAVEYMTTEKDLQALLATAHCHLHPGGLALFLPDDVRETFEPSTDHGGSDAADGRGARYLEWSWDPDVDDSSVLTEYAFVLREANGTVTSVHETHETGLFATATWMRLIRDAGFEARVLREETDEDRTPRVVFTGLRL